MHKKKSTIKICTKYEKENYQINNNIINVFHALGISNKFKTTSLD